MMRAARAAADEEAAKRSRPAPLVIAVTDADEPRRRRRWPKIGFGDPMTAQVERLAALTEAAGLDGVVASPQEIAIVRKRCGPTFAIVTPGIRGAGDAKGDQQRTHERRARRSRQARAIWSSDGRSSRPRIRPRRPPGSSTSAARRRRDSPDALFAPRVSSVRRNEGRRRAGGRARRAERRRADHARDRRHLDRCGARSRYGLEIPVLLVNGKKAAKYRVGEDELLRAARHPPRLTPDY